APSKPFARASTTTRTVTRFRRRLGSTRRPLLPSARDRYRNLANRAVVLVAPRSFRRMTVRRAARGRGPPYGVLGRRRCVRNTNCGLRPRGGPTAPGRIATSGASTGGRGTVFGREIYMLYQVYF